MARRIARGRPLTPMMQRWQRGDAKRDAVAWTPDELDTLHEIWDAIHDPGQRDPDPKRERARLLALIARVPGSSCSCRRHGREWVESLDDATLAEADAHARAAWAFHDDVNAKLGKPRPTLDETRTPHSA